MSVPFLPPQEVADIMRGDLSDIEDFNDGTDDDVDELMAISEEDLQQRLHEFENLQRAADEVSDNHTIIHNQPEDEHLHLDNDIGDRQPNSPIQNDPVDIELENNEVLTAEGETGPAYNPQPRWRKPREFTYLESECDVQLPFPEDLKTPKQYFEEFIDMHIIENLVAQTNLYSVQQTGASINTNRAEIEQFLGIHVLSSIVRMPSYRMYWANETRFSPIADVISRNRFDKLRTYFHVNDNTNMLPLNHPNHDKLFKIRPFVNAVRGNMKKVEPEEKCSVDELIIPFKGRSHMKQYVKNKPHKWGVKVFAIASQSGIVHDFEIYVGKGTVKCTNNKLGLSGEIVIRLTEIIPKHKNFKVFCDNWFTSYHLLCELKVRGILAVGTVRSNRLCGCKLEDDRTLSRKGRGSYDEMIDVENEIFACKWYDNRCVCLVSSYAAAEPVEEVERFSVAEKQRIQVPRPHIVKEYNSAMGGVDLHDMLVELYRNKHRVRRYYLRIIFHLIDMCIVNSWLLYRRHHKQLKSTTKVIPLLEFRTNVAHALLSCGKDKLKKRGRPSNDAPVYRPPSKKYKVTPRPTEDVRFDGVDHWPIPTNDNQRCKNCVQNYTKMKCMKCELFFCLNQKRNCFLSFHQKN